MIFRYATNMLAILMTISKTGTAFAPTPFISHASRVDSRIAMGSDGFLFDKDGNKGKIVVTFESVEETEENPPQSKYDKLLATIGQNYKFTKALFPLNEVFDGVKFPDGKAPEEIFYFDTWKKVFTFIGQSTPPLNLLVNQPKTETSGVFKAVQKVFLDSQNIGRDIPNKEDYNFFGSNKHTENLKYLLKTNPFISSALSKKNDGFEIRSFRKRGVNESDSLYMKLMGTFEGNTHRVNIRFNSDMEIKRIRVYDKISGEMIKNIKGVDEDADYWASAAIYSLGMYASCIHATIHVLHYILTGALEYCSEDFEAMNQWAKMYSTHIPFKYGQVGNSLITGLDHPGSLDAILTGPLGGGFEGSKSRPIYEELLHSWVENPSNWYEVISNISSDELKKSGILTEFYKHHDLVPGFASDVAGSLREIDQDKYTVAELRLKDFIKKCGLEASNINTLEQWIEIMSVSGITHGSTLSYSRAVATPEVLRWRNINTDNWDKADQGLLGTILGTLCGMDEHRHVMMSSVDTPDGSGGSGEGSYASKLQDVLDKYGKEALDLKETYQAKIMEDKDEFNEFGWILSDFCTDGFDGKQLTITTYI